METEGKAPLAIGAINSPGMDSSAVILQDLGTTGAVNKVAHGEMTGVKLWEIFVTNFSNFFLNKSAFIMLGP